MLDDVLNDIPMPQSVSDVTQDIDIGSLPDWNECDNLPKKDIFAVEQRKAWDKSVEARCDFSPKLRLTRRASTNFISLWQKSIFGRTLTEPAECLGKLISLLLGKVFTNASSYIYFQSREDY